MDGVGRSAPPLTLNGYNFQTVHNNETKLSDFSDISVGSNLRPILARSIFGNKYTSYTESLNQLNLVTLFERREKLCLKFALNSSENPKTKQLFTLRKKTHNQITRTENKYEVFSSKTERMARSAVPHLQNLLNKYETKEQKKLKN